MCTTIEIFTIQPIRFNSKATDFFSKKFSILDSSAYSEWMSISSFSNSLNVKDRFFWESFYAKLGNDFLINVSSFTSTNDTRKFFNNNFCVEVNCFNAADEIRFMTFLIVDNFNIFSYCTVSFIEGFLVGESSLPPLWMKKIISNKNATNPYYNGLNISTRCILRSFDKVSKLKSIDFTPHIEESTCHTITKYNGFDDSLKKVVKTIHKEEEFKNIYDEGYTQLPECRDGFVHFGWSFSTLFNIQTKMADELIVNMYFLQSIWYLQRIHRISLESIISNQCISMSHDKDLKNHKALDRICAQRQMMTLKVNRLRALLKPWQVLSFEATLSYWKIDVSTDEMKDLIDISKDVFARKISRHTLWQSRLQTNILFFLSSIQILALVNNIRAYLNFSPPGTFFLKQYNDPIYYALPIVALLSSALFIFIVYFRYIKTFIRSLFKHFLYTCGRLLK